MNAACCTEPAKTLGHIGLTRTPLLKVSRESGLITTWPLLKYSAYRYNYLGVIDASQAVLKRNDGGLVQLQPKIQPILPLLYDICASQSGLSCKGEKKELKPKRLCTCVPPLAALKRLVSTSCCSNSLTNRRKANRQSVGLERLPLRASPRICLHV